MKESGKPTTRLADTSLRGCDMIQMYLFCLTSSESLNNKFAFNNEVSTNKSLSQQTEFLNTMPACFSLILDFGLSTYWNCNKGSLMKMDVTSAVQKCILPSGQQGGDF